MSATLSSTRRLLAGALLAGLAMAFGAAGGTGCDTPLPGDDVCKDVGYAIANKVFECNGDAQASNDAYERFENAHPCKISDLPTEQEILDGRIEDVPRDVVGERYECSAAILRLSCEQANTVGGDYDTFLAASPQCDKVFARTGTGTLPSVSTGGAGGAGGGGPTGAPEATMTLDVSWDNTSFVGTCQVAGTGFVYECAVPSNDREAKLTIVLSTLRQGNLQGPILLDGTATISLVLTGSAGQFTYNPQAHRDDRPFSWSLKNDFPSGEGFRSFTLALTLTHPETPGDDFPVFSATSTITAKNQVCPSAQACP